ncbi:MAG: hypothetical protein ACHREM_24850, partial [Polyangiales bacterium]
MTSMMPASCAPTAPPRASTMHPVFVLSLVPPGGAMPRGKLVALSMPPLTQPAVPTIVAADYASSWPDAARATHPCPRPSGIPAPRISIAPLPHLSVVPD